MSSNHNSKKSNTSRPDGAVTDEFPHKAKRLRNISRVGDEDDEIIEIKNEKKALTNLRSKVHWASDAS